MGQARTRKLAAFSEELTAAWESEQCVNFAVALARLTGWLIHVDWWVPSMNPDEDIPIERFRPLRVYVGDNAEKVFDVRGLRDFVSFTQRTVMPIGTPYGNGALRTRYYDEAGLTKVPLLVQPTEAKIAIATAAIQANQIFLAGIQPRPPSSIPSYLAAKFSLGWCIPFAEALRSVTGLVPAALYAVRYAPYSGGTSGDRRTGDGYFHTVLLHPVRKGEDSWGVASIKEIAERFSVLDYEINTEVHESMVGRLKRNSPENFGIAYTEAERVIKMYRRLAP